MTLYGIGLGPGGSDLLTIRGRRRLSRRVAAEYVPESKLGDLEFPMTTDPDKLETAWKTAAAEVAPRARNGDAAFVTLGDPCIYSTFGHLRRTLREQHPGVDIEAGAELTLREATDGAAPVGPDRLILFKVTDAPTTYEKLTTAGYDVTFGRRLFIDEETPLVTSDPADVADRDYYTLAYAEKQAVSDSG